jgi:hypothetical protein
MHWVGYDQLKKIVLRKDVKRRVACTLSDINNEEELDEPRIATDL